MTFKKLLLSSGMKLTTGFAENKDHLRKRLENIMDEGKKSRGIIIISAVLVLCLLCGSVIGFTAGKDENKPPVAGSSDSESKENMGDEPSANGVSYKITPKIEDVSDFTHHRYIRIPQIETSSRHAEEIGMAITDRFEQIREDFLAKPLDGQQSLIINYTYEVAVSSGERENILCIAVFAGLPLQEPSYIETAFIYLDLENDTLLSPADFSRKIGFISEDRVKEVAEELGCQVTLEGLYYRKDTIMSIYRKIETGEVLFYDYLTAIEEKSAYPWFDTPFEYSEKENLITVDAKNGDELYLSNAMAEGLPAGDGQARIKFGDAILELDYCKDESEVDWDLRKITAYGHTAEINSSFSAGSHHLSVFLYDTCYFVTDHNGTYGATRILSKDGVWENVPEGDLYREELEKKCAEPIYQFYCDGSSLSFICVPRKYMMYGGYTPLLDCCVGLDEICRVTGSAQVIDGKPVLTPKATLTVKEGFSQEELGSYFDMLKGIDEYKNVESIEALIEQNKGKYQRFEFSQP